MNQHNNEIVREFGLTRNIHIACKKCEAQIADFKNVKHNSRHEWKLKTIDLYWNNTIQFEGKELYCECESYLGKLIENNTLSLKKSNVSLVY